MKKRIDTAGCKIDPDDKTELWREANRRDLTLSSLIEKILLQHLAHCKGLPGERDLLKFLDRAKEEIKLSLADDGRITPDEAVRIAQLLNLVEDKVFDYPDLTRGVTA